jgi:hypothetical protein
LTVEELIDDLTAPCAGCGGARTVERFGGKRVRCSKCNGSGRAMNKRQMVDAVIKFVTVIEAPTEAELRKICALVIATVRSHRRRRATIVRKRAASKL